MSCNALPDHQPATLQAYGKRLVRAACSALTDDTTDDAVAVMHSAASALRQAARCYAGASRDYAVYAANTLNASRDALNKLLTGRGHKEFAFASIERPTSTDTSKAVR